MNEVHLVGTVEHLRRAYMPDGGEAITYEISTDAGHVPVHAVDGPWRHIGVGARVEVYGSIRRRFARDSGTIVSRVEVVPTRIVKLTNAEVAS